MRKHKILFKYILTLYLFIGWMGKGIFAQTCPEAAPLQIIVYLDPVVSILTADQILCSGGAVTLEAELKNGTGSCTIQWEKSDNNINWVPLVGENNVLYETGPLLTTTYYRAIMNCDGNGCNQDISSPVTVTVLPEPGVSISSVNEVCTGTPVTLTANTSGGLGGVTYQWQYLNPQGIYVNFPNENNAILNISALLTTTTYRVLSNGTGLSCSNSASKIVAANSLPTITAANDGPYCNNTEVIFRAFGGVNYSWTGPNGFTATGQYPTIPAASINASGLYFLTGTDVNGCVNTFQTNVVISNCNEICDNDFDDDNDGLADCQDLDCGIGPFDLKPGGPLQFCSGDSVVLSVPSYASILWSNAATTNSITVLNSGTYSVTVTNAKGCSDSAVRIVNVFSGVTLSLSSSADFCEGSTVSVTAIGSSTMTWRGPNLFAWSGNPLSINRAKVSQSGWYHLTSSNEFGCFAKDSILITVKPGPQAVFASGGQLNCINNSILLHAETSSAGVSYAWSDGGSFTAATADIATTVPGNYTVSVTRIDNGCSQTRVVNVSQNITLPTVSIDTSVLITCLSDTVQLRATSVPSSVTYSWTGPISNIPGHRVANVWLPGQYIVIAENPKNGCAAQAVINLKENKYKPTIVALGGVLKCDSPACQLQAESMGTPQNFVWSGTNGFASNLEDPIVGFPGSFTVRAIDPDSGCYSDPINVDVIVE